MKLTIVLLLAAFIQVNASVFAQKVSLTQHNASLKEIFEEIREQTGYNFLYSPQLLKKARPVNIDVKNASLEDALKACFDGQPLTYVVSRNTVVIKEPESKPVAPQNKPDIIIKGQITDGKGEPLPGVSIKLKDTSIGTTADADGKFSIRLPDDKGTLVFTFVGFKTQEIAVKDKTVINVKLLEDQAALDEVVVVGFGKQKRTDLIGSVVSVKPSELKVPSSNLTTALAGRVAGMIAYQRSGEPGLDNADFFIRGVTTFGYKVDPLILIDNVEVTSTDLARLQVDDIASFSIMKDATATAIYGARGANGVILITTKEGTEGRTGFSVRMENSLSEPTRNVELADPVTYMRLHNESVLTRSPAGETFYTQEAIDKTAEGTDPTVYPATDWRKYLMKDYTMNQRLNLNINGGGKIARFYVSGALNQDNGVLKVDKRNSFNSNINLKTYSLRSNVNMNLTPTTEFVVRLSGSFDDYTGPIDGGTKVYHDIMRTNPVKFAPYYNPGPDQQFVKHIMFGNYDGTYLNPYANMVKGYKNYSRSMMLAQLELNQKLSFITEGLSVRALANTTRNSYFDVTRDYNPFYYQLVGVDHNTGNYQYSVLNEETGTEYLDYSEGQKTVSSVFYLESALNYNRTFNKKHTLGGLLVYIMRQTLNANAGDLQQSLPFRNLGLSGRFTYGYDSRYFAEFNFGYNGSERFHESHRYGFFPSVGVAWSISNEKFWEPVKKVISSLRLRGTYGLVGNDAIGGPEDRFFYLSNVNMNDEARGAGFGTERTYVKNGISISRYPNENITWEMAYKTNLGLELGLFNDVQIMADFFTERRTNILMSRASIPATMGLNALVRANVGEASGRGLDMSLDYSHHFGKGLWLQSRANFTYATSKFKVYEEPNYPEKYQSRIGYPITEQWGYIAERLFVDDEEVASSPHQNFGQYMGGDIKYRDVNNDGQITSLDMVPIGYPTTPEIVYGFGFSAGYHSMDFSAFFQGLGRESFWINAAATSPFGRFVYSGETFPASATLQNQLLKAYADDHWSEEHRNLYALWPRLSSTRVANNEVASTWFMRNGAFLRLKQVEVGYTLSEKASKKLHMDKLRLYLSSTNLFTWSSFKLWDVEMGGNGLGYPIQQVFNIGIQASL